MIKSQLTRLMNALRYRWAALDPKLKYAGASYLLTKLIVSGGIDVTGDFIPGYLSWANVIALGAAAVAGYKKRNDGSLLRQGVEDGSANVPKDVELRTEPPEPLELAEEGEPEIDPGRPNAQPPRDG